MDEMLENDKKQNNLDTGWALEQKNKNSMEEKVCRLKSCL